MNQVDARLSGWTPDVITPPPPEQLLTTREAARLLGVTVDTARHYIATGRLSSRAPRGLRIPAAEVAHLLRHTSDVDDLIVQAWEGGASPSVIARQLNEDGYRTVRGRPWYPNAVKRVVLRRMHGRQETNGLPRARV